MLEYKYSDFVNEEMATISNKKLRDAIHDIVMDLEPKKSVDIEEMSNILLNDYKITISPYFLDKFMDDFLKSKRGDNKVSRNIFTKNDARWLGVRELKGSKEIRNNLLYLKPSLSKHKRKLFIDEDKKKLDDAYKNGMKDLSFSEDVIKSSIVLQKPDDSIELMKIIYNDIMFLNKYDNTYDNCWKIMMIIARNNKLDRARGWFKLAPQLVKDEYIKTKRINYILTKTPVKKKVVNLSKSNDIKPVMDSDSIGDYLKKNRTWDIFIRNSTLRDIITLIDDVIPETNIKFNDFLEKIDKLTNDLIKYYKVSKDDVITFYKNIGFAGYLREWSNNDKRPKINSF